MILNPEGPFFSQCQRYLDQHYEDQYWWEDAMVLERNSRNVEERIAQINRNAEMVCELLRKHPLGRNIYV